MFYSFYYKMHILKCLLQSAKLVMDLYYQETAAFELCFFFASSV